MQVHPEAGVYPIPVSLCSLQTKIEKKKFLKTKSFMKVQMQILFLNYLRAHRLRNLILKERKKCPFLEVLKY